jgi:hypothetical protein
MAHMGEKRNAQGTLDEEPEPSSPLQMVVDRLKSFTLDEEEKNNENNKRLL